MTKKLHIKTFGCQMNVYDSGRMVDLLAPLGWECVDDPADADLVLLNTCHIREKAAEKVYSELGRLAVLKRRPADAGGPVLLAVAGCVAQAEGEEVLARAPWVDIVVGPQSYHRLPRLVAEAAGRGGGVVDIEFPPEPKFDSLPEASARSDGPSAFLSVQEGCDKFCSFCVVPYTRGAEYSRPAAAVLAEARRLVARGACEITLLGQNVNAWRGAADDAAGTWGLARLIEALAAVPGVERIRYTTSHPRDHDDALIAAHGRVPQLMPYVHLPVQSGSDRILAAMNRRHRAADYLRLVERLRRSRPDLALSSDFIVGFPGETDDDFRATLSLIDAVGFAQAYSFKYSARPGTPAADLPQLPEAIKRERLQALQEMLDAQQRAFNDGRVGAAVPVLFERCGRRPGQIVGRSPWMQTVHVEGGPALIGRIETVRIVASGPNSLAGRLAHGAGA